MSRMYLNSLKPAQGAKKEKVRVGRGIGSGLGKTCGRGHKGQRARAGGFHKVGFEGGQMPLQRRLPKFGFKSLARKYHQTIRLDRLDSLPGEEVSLLTLEQANLINRQIKSVKIVLGTTKELNRVFRLNGVEATDSVKKIIELAGGSV